MMFVIAETAHGHNPNIHPVLEEKRRNNVIKPSTPPPQLQNNNISPSSEVLMTDTNK